IDFVNSEFRSVTSPGAFAAAEKRDEKLVDLFRRNGTTQYVDIDLRAASYTHYLRSQGLGANEIRTLQTDGGSSGGSLTVPTTVESSVWSYFISSNAMRRLPCTVLTTAGGEAHNVPRVATHSVATQVASQTTTFAGTDPVLGAVVLNAYDYGELLSVSND